MPAQQMRGSVTALTGGRAKIPKLDGHLWVPIDDEQTYVYNWACAYSNADPISPEYAADWEAQNGRGIDDLVPGTFRLKKTLANDYMIDRERAAHENVYRHRRHQHPRLRAARGMGPISDRTNEHLGSSDKAIIATRQLLLEAIDACCGPNAARNRSRDVSRHPSVRRLRAARRRLARAIRGPNSSPNGKERCDRLRSELVHARVQQREGLWQKNHRKSSSRRLFMRSRTVRSCAASSASTTSRTS